MSRLPQAFDRVTSIKYHLWFIGALLPVVVSAVFAHGWTVAVLVVLSVGTAVGCDFLLRRMRNSLEAFDLSSGLWGLLLGLLLPANCPFYVPILGSAFAVLGVKGLLGGGVPWINPVLAAWAFLHAGWPKVFAPLAALASDHRSLFDAQATEWLNANIFSWLSIQLPGGYLDLVMGFGKPESALIVESGGVWLLGATVVLLGRGLLPWQVPAFFFAGFCVPLAIVGDNLLFQVFSGSFLLCQFFLASDPSSRPLANISLLVFAGGAGILAFLVRTWGGGVDGVGYAVLLMNVLVPWLDQKMRRKSLNDFRLT